MTGELVVINEDILRTGDISALPQEIQQTVLRIKDSIDLTNMVQITQFGLQPQNRMAKVAEKAFSKFNPQDKDEVNAILSQMIDEINTQDFANIIKEQRTLEAAENIDQAKMQALTKKIMEKRNSLEEQLTEFVKKLNSSKKALYTDIEVCELMFNENVACLKEVDLHVLAGILKVKEAKESLLPQMMQQSQETNDIVLSQQVNDFERSLYFFEKKIHEMGETRIIVEQALAQIRIIQMGDAALVQEIQTNITTGIPVCKNHLVMALSQIVQSNALRVQKAMRKITNELIVQNAEMLKTRTVELANELGKDFVDVETLQKAHDDLVSTIEAITQIHEETSTKREDAKQQMVLMEKELKQILRVQNNI